MTAQLAAPEDRASAPADQDGELRPSGHDSRRRSGLGKVWARVRTPLALLALVVIGVTLITLLVPQPKSNIYLDPADSSLSGAKALVGALGDRGFDVISVYSPASALSELSSATSNNSPATLVITSPGLLTATQRTQLARARADLFLVEPGPSALAAFAPAIRVASASAESSAVEPGCGLIAARLAGSADLGATTYQVPGYATGCYLVSGSPALVRYERSGQTITILGSGLLMSNGLLAQDGNAALTLNLLNARRTIVWLTPEPKIAHQAPQASRKAGPALIPHTAWLVVLQLCVALALAAIWRVRRLGPLITERLPVVVRASETVEGHARLYQSRRARDRAASTLRAALIARMRPLLGLDADAPLDAVAEAIADRSRLSTSDITAILDGPAPASDADLVKLADDLDKLEREVRAQ